MELRLGGGYKGSHEVHEVCGKNMLCTLRNIMKETENGKGEGRRQYFWKTASLSEKTRD
jgi:hypothetical protein